MTNRSTATLRRRVVRIALAVVALLVVIGEQPVLAQTPSPTEPAVVESWAVTPTGSDPSEPSSRPALTYTAQPGSTVQDSVTLWNYSNVQLTFRIYATDAFNNADGAFDLLPGKDTPKDTGTWITLPQPYVTVPAHSSMALPITLTVPAGAQPGDHAGAILASNEAQGTGADGKTVTLDRRTGTRVYVRVGGPLTPALTVTKAHSVYHPSLDPRHGHLDVTYTVRNVGNVRLAATRTVLVKNILGREIDHTASKPVDELLPGNEVTVVEHFDGVAATVRVGAEIRVTPLGGTDVDASTMKSTSRTATTWAFPWLLVLVALLLVLGGRGIRWVRQRTAPRPTNPRPPSREPRASRPRVPVP